MPDDRRERDGKVHRVTPGAARAPAWQDRAVERSLERARAEAAARSEKIVRAAMELAESSPTGDFTIQAVVERIQLSTRTFYQHFGGKDDLIVAMFEEAQREGARALHRVVDAETDPLLRLRAFVIGRQNVADSGLSRLLIVHHFRLQESHPDELRHAVEPAVALLRELIAAAAEGRAVEVADVDKATEFVFLIVTSAIQARVLRSEPAGAPLSPEDVWDLCLRGLSGGS